MINSTLIIPTESPIAIDDLKRALVTFDKVFLPSPEDREFIPPNVYDNVRIKSLGFLTMPFGGTTWGAIRPLGKVEGYDQSFEKLLDKSKHLIKEGKVEILGAPKYTQETTSLGVTPPADTRSPLFTYVSYRTLSENQEFVDLIALGLEKIDFTRTRDLSQLSPSGHEDTEITINDVTQAPKAKINKQGLNDDENKVLTRIAHARIGSLVKYIGCCQDKGINPFTTDKGIASVISKLEFQFVGNINQIEEALDVVKKQKRINTLQNFIFKEYVDPQKLQHLSLTQIIKLRTKAWGKNREGKFRLWGAINKIAMSCETDSEFERECKKHLNEYFKASEDYRNEVDKLKLSIVFDANLLAFLNTEGYELIERILKAPSFELLLILGGLTAKNAKGNIPGIIDLLDRSKELNRTSGYAIFNNYKYLV